jgi:hypothetical protein
MGKDWTGGDRSGQEGSGFFPQSQKCDGGTSKGVERSGRDGIGLEGNGADWKGFNQSPLGKLSGLFS